MIGLRWIGVDGSNWDLRNGPVRVTKDGVEGLGKPPTKAIVRTSTETDGQRLIGVNIQARPVVLPVFINHSLPTEMWHTIQLAWWRSIDEEKYGTLQVTDPDGGVRSIQLRFESDGPYEFDYDPSDLGISKAICEFAADDPFFRGRSRRIEIEPPPGDIDFFGPDGYGPPFYISAGASGDATIVNNPGDFPSWAVITIPGPATAFDINIDGHTLRGEVNVLEHSRLVIDTRPNRKTVRLYAPDGTYQDKFRELEQFDFAAIQPGANVPVISTISGGSTTVIEFETLYKRGF